MNSVVRVCMFLVLAGCGGAASGPGPSAADSANQARAAAEAQLHGTWRISQYQPDVPLEPMLASLLALQMQTMTVRFDNGRIVASSPTMPLDVPYRIVDAGGPFFKMIATKDGADYLSSCQLSENADQLAFRAETQPWLGRGTLVRLSH